MGPSVRPNAEEGAAKIPELTTTADGRLSPPMLMVSLDHAVHIGPQQTTVADVRVLASQNEVQCSTGLVVPKEDIMTPKNCDLMEGIWLDQASLTYLSTD